MILITGSYGSVVLSFFASIMDESNQIRQNRLGRQPLQNRTGCYWAAPETTAMLRTETTPVRAMDVGVQLCLRAGYALRHYQPECQLRRKQTFGLTC